MRNDFWSSRVEGNIHMWQNIRSAAEALVSNDLMLANAILEVNFFPPVLVCQSLVVSVGESCFDASV